MARAAQEADRALREKAERQVVEGQRQGGPKRISGEMIELLEIALAYLDTHGSDAALISLWESDSCPGIREDQRLEYLELARTGRLAS